MLRMEQKSTKGCGNCSYWSGYNDQFLLVVTVDHPFPTGWLINKGVTPLSSFFTGINYDLVFCSTGPFFVCSILGAIVDLIENTPHLGVFEAIPAVSALEELPTVATVSYQGASPLSQLMAGNSKNRTIWLVVTGTWTDYDFPFHIWECHHPNWRIHIFLRGWYTTNQLIVVYENCFRDVPGMALFYWWNTFLIPSKE